MTSSSRAEVARVAAAILRDKRATTIVDAIRVAAERAGCSPQAIAVSDVRQHLRAMALESLGDVGYGRHVAEVLTKAEEVMTLLSTLSGEPSTALVGRAARRDIDGDPTCRVRVWTDETIGEIAALVVAAGYNEPAFATIESRFGRLSQLVFADDNVELRVTRCPVAAGVPRDLDFKTGQRVASLTLDSLRQVIADLQMPPSLQ